ncbi:putative phage abortive infection protein [Flavobacterium saccharophilum]|uniref:Putative phage abortive infection protein n=1 Tax=Flavobacterium saccharophilum TaxID=29534 RepID=A0A1M7MD59_9FLAO|nr:putative phage abortive infection protein [Flavobacterium saccharophilum]SHM88680.1 Putative phage abortive infection protein [Flavobacterium saccharophilum]
MKTFVIIFSVLILLIIIVLFYLFSLFTSNKISNSNSIEDNILAKKYKLRWEAYLLIIIALFFIVGSFFAPLILTSTTDDSDFNFMLTGQIGDTIGGLMNPFITLGGVLITGLAFYVQYKANELQRELFIINQKDSKKQFQDQIDHQNEQYKLQQIESQFYEMLKLHRENISEMKIEGYDFEEFKQKEGEETKFLRRFEKNTEGRKVFVTMKTELEFILQLYKKHNTLDKIGFEKCYRIFFSGIDESDRKHPEDKDFTAYLRLARAQHMYSGESILTNHKRKEYLGLDMNFNYKPFSGHASRLGHYFRHLYLVVKSIANNTTITNYDDKIKYLRLLRAQLSNHEQILLFYNWLSDYGGSWENDSQNFFTEYMMIHNLWWDNLIEDDFIRNQVNHLRTKTVKFRIGNMFEIG